MMKFVNQPVGENGRVVCPGVVCKCSDPASNFCPAHGAKTALRVCLEETDPELREKRLKDLAKISRSTVVMVVNDKIVAFLTQVKTAAPGKPNCEFGAKKHAVTFETLTNAEDAALILRPGPEYVRPFELMAIKL